jgi:hypothetical protein
VIRRNATVRRRDLPRRIEHLSDAIDARVEPFGPGLGDLVVADPVGVLGVGGDADRFRACVRVAHLHLVRPRYRCGHHALRKAARHVRG